MSNKNNLPYFKIKSSLKYSTSAKFLKLKFISQLRKKQPYHYLITQNHSLYLKFIQEKSKTHPYYLRFDIYKYFPCLDHQILLKQIQDNYCQLANKPLSRRFKLLLKNELPEFLQNSPFPNKGLPLGSGLSQYLAGIYMLNLDLFLPFPFLRFCDDYLIFFKKREQIEKTLKNLIQPEIAALNLSLNLDKLYSGKLHQDKTTFLGFEFSAGYIRISQEKIDNFRKKIVKITHLTRHKPYSVIIKQLNNQILGFGHYYKFASCHNLFQDLDAFIRNRLRRYIQRNKNSKNKQLNLVLTNSILKSLGLKSLENIYQKHERKSKHNFVKTNKITNQISHKTISAQSPLLEQSSLQFQQKAVFNQLNQLTGLIKKMDRKLNKINKELKNRKRDE